MESNNNDWSIDCLSTTCSVLENFLIFIEVDESLFILFIMYGLNPMIIKILNGGYKLFCIITELVPSL